MNSQAYVGGDPINFTDPTGLSAFEQACRAWETSTSEGIIRRGVSCWPIPHSWGPEPATNPNPSDPGVDGGNSYCESSYKKAAKAFLPDGTPKDRNTLGTIIRSIAGSLREEIEIPLGLSIRSGRSKGARVTRSLFGNFQGTENSRVVAVGNFNGGLFQSNNVFSNKTIGVIIAPSFLGSGQYIPLRNLENAYRANFDSDLGRVQGLANDNNVPILIVSGKCLSLITPN